MPEMAQCFDLQGLTRRSGCINKVILPETRKALRIK